jgi:putative methyltransferase
MSQAAETTVLISEPQGSTGALQFDNSRPYLPYVSSVLKSYWERHGQPGAPVEWLDPIWWNDKPEVMLAPYGGRRIDVLGLSCYTWNWAAQCLVAAQVKAEQPDCVVVAGGPEPDYKDPEFFAQHPYIDAIAVKDGEITFQHILAKVTRGDRDLSDVPGLYLPGAPGAGHRFTGPTEVPTVFDHSPYVDQTAYYERLLRTHPDLSFGMIFETTRGCPYGCSYCDWGSNTLSKVRRFDMERVAAEIDWMGRMGIGTVMMADANFGILPRDVEIADLLNDARARYHGYPQFFFYSAAKNNPRRATEIALKFAKSGICTNHALSIQHTKPSVLAATNRSNISPQRQVEVVKTMMAARVPVEVQLILGIPGDTYELWQGCLADLMEWGIHEDFLMQAYRLLPNAPAAEREFLDEWQVDTIDRITYDLTSRHVNVVGDGVARKPDRIVVSSKTYSRADWVRISTYSAFIKALHNCSLTQRIAMYLRLTHGVPYLDFYTDLIDKALPAAELTGKWHRTLSDHYRNYLDDDELMDFFAVPELPDLPYLLHPARWLYVQACLHLDEFFAVLTDHLTRRYPDATNLAGAIRYQKELVILPSYDRRVGKTFRVDHDWITYFEQARTRDGAQPLDEPAPLPGALVRAGDQEAGERGINGDLEYYSKALDWHDSPPERRWQDWIDRTVLGRSSAAMHNFQDLIIAGRGDLPERPQPR